MKKRWRYYIDKDFQNTFIIRFSLVVILNAFFTLGLLWLVREKSYNLLPNNASVLVQVDPEKAVQITMRDDLPVLDEENGKFYFPLKSNEEVPPKLYNAFDLYLQPIVLTSILNIFVISIFSVFFSHKMAGPIRRIKNTLQDFSEHKQVAPIKLRSGDFFKDLAELVNRAIFRKEKKDD